MRSLWNEARNLLCLAVREGTGPDAPTVMIPHAEIVLMTAEGRYRLRADGSGADKYQDLETVRFSATAEALDEHIRFLAAVRDELVGLEGELGAAGLRVGTDADPAAADEEVTP